MSDYNITLTINGDPVSATVPARRTLADFLRMDCGLTGTHLGCEHGVCGACTVIVDGQAVRSCLMFAVQAVGAEVRTIEGVARDDGALHPVQAAFRDEHALQCGFCTPGIVMTLVEMSEASPPASEEEMLGALSGHLCRCTGYQGIRRAVKRIAGNGEGEPEMRHG